MQLLQNTSMVPFISSIRHTLKGQRFPRVEDKKMYASKSQLHSFEPETENYPLERVLLNSRIRKVKIIDTNPNASTTDRTKYNLYSICIRIMSKRMSLKQYFLQIFAKYLNLPKSCC